MLSVRLVALALVAFTGLVSSSSQAAQPYAPELYERDQLESSGAWPRTPGGMVMKRAVSSRAAVDDADQPYSPELFYRALLDDNSQQQAASTALEKRSTHTHSTDGKRVRHSGQSCKHAHDVCDHGLFCSTVTATCKHQRGLHAGCRTDDGCSGTLTCLNYKCTKKPNPAEKHAAAAGQKGHPSAPKNNHPGHPSHPHVAHPSAPSGAPWDKRQLHHRKH